MQSLLSFMLTIFMACIAMPSMYDLTRRPIEHPRCDYSPVMGMMLD
jgi:hypothetical protein